MMAKSLLTIGYEGSTIADFLATIRKAKVDTIVDIRDVPVSRKAGFSKNSLAEALGGLGISYVHLRLLGDPKEGRDAARAGNYDEFKRIYTAHLRRAATKAELREAVEVAKNSVACLLCYEREPKHCHRSMVAESMCALAQFKVMHLGVRDGLAGPARPNAKNDERNQLRKVG